MKHYIYIIRDKKLGAYQEPIFSREDQEHYVEGTIRGLKFVKDEEVPRARDMALYYLGLFDDLEGSFELLKDGEKLIDYEDYVKKVEVVSDGKGS